MAARHSVATFGSLPLDPYLKWFSLLHKARQAKAYIIAIMGDEITIDKTIFHDRLSSFINQWKNDKRVGDALFSGAESIVLLVGKASETGTYSKTTAFQVRK